MKRITVIEGKACPQSLDSLAEEINISSDELTSCLYSVCDTLSQRLSLNGILHVSRNRFSFNNIAGVFPVADYFEIEVVPKFMSESATWRTDFLLLLLARTQWGALFEQQMVAASKSQQRDLNDLLAATFLTMYDAVSHVPIRVYRRKLIHEFPIEGEVDEESILLPEMDGFTQMVTEFTKRNPWNAVIYNAANALLQSTSNFDSQSRLVRAMAQLGRQDQLPSVLPQKIPARFRNWQQLYDLCISILDGYGADYTKLGEELSPGFVVRTADAWEEFLRQLLIAGLNDCKVLFQNKYHFARRNSSPVMVRPDYTLRASDGTTLLIDAKYKYDVSSSNSIANADIYEGWAFMEASGVPRLVLLYPGVASQNSAAVTELQRITDDDKQIIGVRISPELAATGGMDSLAKELAEFISPYFT